MLAARLLEEQHGKVSWRRFGAVRGFPICVVVVQIRDDG